MQLYLLSVVANLGATIHNLENLYRSMVKAERGCSIDPSHCALTSMR